MSVTGLQGLLKSTARLLHCASSEERANFYRQIKIELERAEIQNEKCQRLIEVASCVAPGVAWMFHREWPTWLVGFTVVAWPIVFSISFTTPAVGIPYLCLAAVSAAEAWVRKTRDLRRMEREFAARRLTEGV